MQPVIWCNLCQSRPATGSLRGFFEDLPNEEANFMVCNQCAAEAMKRGE